MVLGRRLRRLVKAVAIFAGVQLIIVLYAGYMDLMVTQDAFGPHNDNQARDLLSYTPPWDSTIHGRRFDNVSMATLRRLHIPASKYIQLESGHVVGQFVVVVACDQVYFPSAVDAIATIQQHLPLQNIILYDLGGVKPRYSHQVERLCQVEYRQLDFSLYPPHIKELTTYAWKAIIINEVLLKYPGVFLVDASIRFIQGHFERMVTSLLHTEGVLGFSTSGHSNFATTHQQMYEYLPTDIHGMQESEQMESGSVLYYRTKNVCQNILHWMLLCSLQKSCIAPTRNRGCLQTNHKAEYADCHRFDQSALNILLANKYGFDHEQYLSKEHLIKVERYTWGRTEVTICENDVYRKKVASRELFPGRSFDG